ncbi:MAG: nucleotide exchange factor GrpE [Ignavibacteriaceae bacterium]|nr:nucleotide exchange factor GrpE [Ignavibacteriaceae bacterium]
MSKNKQNKENIKETSTEMHIENEITDTAGETAASDVNTEAQAAASDETEAQTEQEQNLSEKDEVISRLKRENQELKEKQDLLIRNVAELENIRRRNEKEKSDFFRYEGESIIRRLLPVIDDFERSLTEIEKAKEVDSVKKGIQLIHQKLTKVLEESGVQKIDSVGKEFNVDLHDALMHQTTPDYPPHTVVSEFAPAYMFKDKVIRHAQVVVSDENSGAQNSEESVAGGEENN